MPHKISNNIYYCDCKWKRMCSIKLHCLLYSIYSILLASGIYEWFIILQISKTVKAISYFNKAATVWAPGYPFFFICYYFLTRFLISNTAFFHTLKSILHFISSFSSYFSQGLLVRVILIENCESVCSIIWQGANYRALIKEDLVSIYLLYIYIYIYIYI